MKCFSLSLLLMVGFLLAILTIPLISGITYQSNKNVDVKIPCSLDGYPCSGSATCNFTVIYPNSSYLVNDQVMTNLDNGDFNYTTLFPNAGTYQAEASCQDGGQNGTSIFNIDVNESGEELSTSQGIVYMIFLIAILFVFSLCLFGAIKLPFKNKRDGEGVIMKINDLKFLKIFLMAMSYILLMWIFGILRSITAGFLFSSTASAIFNWLYWIMFGFLWPMMVMSLFFSVIMFLQGQKLKKALDRGIKLR